MPHPDNPPQIEGGFQDTVGMHCSNTVDTAIADYEKLQVRLSSVIEWQTLSDKVKAKFTLFGPKTGQPTNGLTKGKREHRST